MPADPYVASMLSALASADAQPAWTEFLSRYSGLIYHIVHAFDRDPDRSGDCFLFVCEQLSRDQFRRIRKFQVDGRASFSTWLCAVVRNLCLDWHRKEHGRPRPFKSIAQKSRAEQMLAELVFRRGFTAEEARAELKAQGLDLSYDKVEAMVDELRRGLSSRQLWLLSSGSAVVESLEEADGAREIANADPNPEELAALKEVHAQASAALDLLGDGDRLLLRLRFLEGLTLQQIARLVGMKDTQSVDRRIRDVLQQVRQKLGLEGAARGKAKIVSV